MKRMSKLLLMALMMVTVSMVTFAQNAEQKNKRNQERKPGAQKERITPEQFAERQARSIASTLAFDDATTTRFVETFCNYRKELIALKGKDKKQPKAEAAPQVQGEKPEARKPRMEKKERTEAETKEMLEGRFEMNQKMLDLRKKYYNEYSKFLTYKQIARVYEIEKEMMCARGKGGASRKGEAFGKPGFQKNPGDQRRNGAGNKADGRPNRQ